MDQHGLTAKEQVWLVEGESLRRSISGILAAPANGSPAAGGAVPHRLRVGEDPE